MTAQIIEKKRIIGREGNPGEINKVIIKEAKYINKIVKTLRKKITLILNH